MNHSKIYAALLLALALFPSSLWAQSIDISSLNQKIKDAGADWIAGETSVSRLSMEEARSLMGARLHPHPEVQFEVPEYTHSNHAFAEVQVDWRNRNGKNWVTSVKNQGSCGSCVAFAAIATLETQYQITNNSPTSQIKLSPQFVFSCGGGDCAAGWFPNKAAAFLKSTGAPDESCMPYKASNLACNRACADAASRTLKISSYSTPTQGTRDLALIKSTLLKGPLSTTLSVYQDFMAYRGGVYKHISGKYIGDHAVSLVGYDDAKRAFIIRNSWGTSWGERGFAYVSYDDISGLGAETWKFNLAAKAYNLPGLDLNTLDIEEVQPTKSSTEAEEVSTESSRPFLVLSASPESAFTYLLQASSAQSFKKIEFHQRSDDGKEKTTEVTLRELELLVKINPQVLAKGSWEIYFKAFTDTDSMETEHYFFDVQNKTAD